MIASKEPSPVSHTRARVGRDAKTHLKNGPLHVSIHAPAWGATIAKQGGDLSRCFNPRARVGRDLRLPPCAAPRFGFNPRARVGRDLYNITGKYDIDVSIHAPAWGATLLLAYSLSVMWFQSTRPRGARRMLCRCRTIFVRFNPRARVGRDTALWLFRIWRMCFNPRARVGRDNDQCHITEAFWVSIHAPAWGATRP